MIKNNNSQGARAQSEVLSTEDVRKFSGPKEALRGNRMSERKNVKDNRATPVGVASARAGAAPGWWVVFVKELKELWIGGKAPILMVVFCMVQGGFAYALLLPDNLPTPRPEMTYLIIKAAISVAICLGVILGADTISGERERGTLESLLLTPTSRRQILVGKFLAASSLWPASLIVTIPYLAVLADSGEGFVRALFCGVMLGSLIAPAFAGLGMFVSFLSNSNRNSLLVSLAIYFIFLTPTTFPWETQIGTVGRIFRRLNPMEANAHFLDKVITVNWPLGAYWPWLTSSVVFALLIYWLLFWYAAPGLRLEGGRKSRFWSSWGRRLGLSVLAGLMMVFLI